MRCCNNFYFRQWHRQEFDGVHAGLLREASDFGQCVGWYALVHPANVRDFVLLLSSAALSPDLLLRETF